MIETGHLLEIVGAISTALGTVYLIHDQVSAEKETELVGNIDLFIETLRDQTHEWKKDAAKTVAPSARVPGTNMTFEQIDTIMAGAAEDAEPENRKVKLEAMRNRDKAAERRRPLKRTALALTIAGAVLTALGAVLPAVHSEAKSEGQATVHDAAASLDTLQP
jgi:uncharacterized membrane protein